MQNFILNQSVPKEEIKLNQRKIYDSILAQSSYLETGNFELIHNSDLELLFSLYEEIFFENRIRATLQDIPLHFECSNRMTSAGAKTETFARRMPDGTKQVDYFVIKVSTKLLYNTFEDGDRPITVTGILCIDRLQAMQRLLEHELVHLLEHLVWGNSSCSANRFQSIAHRFFGHTQHTHDLITPRERAKTEYSLEVGCQVKFEFEGETFIGFINRITTRATVLVESLKGRRYSDGKQYEKYYIPLDWLKKL